MDYQGAQIWWVTALSAIVDSAVFWLVLSGQCRQRRQQGKLPQIRFLELAVAVAAAGVTFVFKAVAWRVLFGVSMFGFLRLLYADLVVAIPILAAAVLVLHWRLRSAGPLCSKPVIGCAIVGVLAAGVGYHATYIEPYRLQVDEVRVDVPDVRQGSKPIRIGVLADIQTDRVTDYEQRVVDTMLALEPDIILLPGDLFQGSLPALKAEMPALRALLSRLHAPGGVYFVQGNVDWTSELVPLIGGTGVQLLVDDVCEIELHGRRITLAGLRLHLHRNESRGKEIIRELEQRPGEEDIRIVLGHYPDWVLDMSPDSRIDLVVAGHTHGGQVSVPLFGPPITLTRVPREIAAGGLHDFDGRAIYVSRGVGMERGQAPRLRLFCPPCVSLLTIE